MKITPIYRPNAAWRRDKKDTYIDKLKENPTQESAEPKNTSPECGQIVDIVV